VQRGFQEQQVIRFGQHGLELIEFLDDLAPFLRDEDGLPLVVIVGYQDNLASRILLAVVLVHNALVKGHGFVAELDCPNADFDLVLPLDGGQKGDLQVGQDHTDFQEGTSGLEEREVAPVMDTGMFKKGDEFGVVDMTLGIQITVADINWLVEVACSHVQIIPSITGCGDRQKGTIGRFMGYNFHVSKRILN